MGDRVPAKPDTLHKVDHTLDIALPGDDTEAPAAIDQRFEEGLVDQVADGAGEYQQPGEGMPQIGRPPAIQRQKYRGHQGQQETKDRQRGTDAEDEAVIEDQAKLDVGALFSKKIDLPDAIDVRAQMLRRGDETTLLAMQIEVQVLRHPELGTQIDGDDGEECAQPDRGEHLQEGLGKSDGALDQCDSLGHDKPAARMAGDGASVKQGAGRRPRPALSLYAAPRKFDGKGRRLPLPVPVGNDGAP